MTLEEIKNNVDNGVVVFWKSANYTVKVSNEDYNIVCESNGHTIGLTWMNGITMNGKEKDFYLGEMNAK